MHNTKREPMLNGSLFLLVLIISYQLTFLHELDECVVLDIFLLDKNYIYFFGETS